VDLESSSHNLGAYWNNDWKLDSAWTVKPGLRLDYFSTIKKGYVAPRFSVKRNFNPFQSLRLATGLYFQPPREQETAREVGNPVLRAPRATHVALSYEDDLRRGSSRGFIVTGGPFYKKLDYLVSSSTDVVVRNGVATPEFYNNRGSGSAYGFETLLRYEANPWNGWLSYTLSRSNRTLPGQPTYPSANDQTHNVNLIIGRDLPRNWRIASRFRYVTGNPITPVTGSVFDSDNDSYIPLRGPYYSERVGSFFQLDVRADKKWIYNRWVLTAYLDIQNLTNRKNTESVAYAYDYSSRQDVTGLPLIPSLGLKGEF
jgi:hypothetical protein